ncbi:U1 small nuclear ribonucleoprotein C [Cryptococcus neoformans]|nr:U1 small nuclear ribonucleoprotein C [Cryptococcus neoformans var. grubii c45]OXB35290.1 U1 small nuclear ribonucleoprotein C [Cryptococcus neoformans var. grubii]OXC59421.1 U1 small nuclear ribonucleoprotein C [Cryptococcus neoformans var. grubii MW-RSA852]UOH83300.1 U1 small nuclear ribonucleoprotein C [Cryptococcus neoformans]
MGKYYCDYCDIYLTHDSMNARKAHNSGRNHVANVRDYFAGLGGNQAQSLIDQIIQQHESGGRNQMMMAPSMRLGAGFMNPLATQPGYPGPPPSGAFPTFPPTAGTPPFRPPFPPSSAPGAPPPSMPPFLPPGASAGAGMGSTPPFPPNTASPNPGMPPFRPPMGMGMPSAPAQAQGSPMGMPQQGQQAAFTPAQEVPQGAGAGIHPDRLRMLGQ